MQGIEFPINKDRGTGAGVRPDFGRTLRRYKNPSFKSTTHLNYGGHMANKHPELHPENITPLQKGSARAKEVSRLGNEALKKRMAERKKMKEELDTLLKISLKRGDIISADDVLSLEEADDANISVQTAINIAMIKRAIMGDVQAAQYLRDTVGEKPTDKVEVDQSLTIEEWAKNHKVKL